jgi:hypothetical protein
MGADSSGAAAFPLLRQTFWSQSGFPHDSRALVRIMRALFLRHPPEVDHAR